MVTKINILNFTIMGLFIQLQHCTLAIRESILAHNYQQWFVYSACAGTQRLVYSALHCLIAKINCRLPNEIGIIFVTLTYA